jgi:DNA polymerase-3 subunit alpha
MAALLSSEIDDGNKRDILVEHIADARRLGVDVRAPDVNAGEADFTVEGGTILFGLTAIKGVGRGAAEEIVRLRREGGAFTDLFDLCERIDPRIVTRAALERLIKAGALDCFGARRSQLMAALPRALQAAAEVQQDRRHGQKSLFGAPAGESDDSAAPAEPRAPSEALPDLPEWSDSEKLKNEKEALDFYFSSHPLTQHEEVLRRFATHTVESLGSLGVNQEVVLGGLLTQVRRLNTKKARNGNTRYVRCKLEDFTGTVECVMWPDDFARCKDEVLEDRVCFVRGAVERTREEPGLILTRILRLEQAQVELARGLWLGLTLGVHGPTEIDAIARVLRRAPGSCPVYLTLRDASGKRGVLRAGDGFRVNPANVAVGELETLLGNGSVKFAGAVNGKRG